MRSSAGCPWRNGLGVYHHPLGLSNPTLCASQKNVVLISAVSRPQRNEGGVYHTLPGLSNSHPRLPVAVRSLDFVQVLGSEALARPWRNEGGIYHTPQGLSNPCHRTLKILRHLGLAGARPSTAQRGATILSFHDPVKSDRGCSWIPRIRNDIGRKGVPGCRPGAQMGNDAGLVYTSAWHVNSAERSRLTWAMWRIFILIRGGALRNAQVSSAKLAGHARINTLRGPPGYRADTRSPQVRPQCQFLSIVRWRRHPQPS